MASTLSPRTDKLNEKPNNLCQTGADPVEQARDAASSIGDTAKDAASAVLHSAEDAAAYVGHKAEDATTAVGDGLQSLSNSIRAHTPQDGVVADASTAVANTLESTGRYLQEEGLQGMAEDVTGLVRRNPIPALLIAVGVGFLIARAITSRS